MKGCSCWGATDAHLRLRPGELVAGHRVLDAELLQVAGAVAGADALQAAHRLGAGGGQRVALLYLVEAGGAARLARLGHGGALRRLGGDAHLQPDRAALGETLAERAQLGGVADLLEVGLAGVDGQLLLELDEVVTAEPGVDGERRALAGCDGVDHRARAGDGVAGGEHAVGRRAARVVVGLDGVPRRQRDLFARVAELGDVRDGGEHRGGGTSKRESDLAGAVLVRSRRTHSTAPAVRSC